MTRPVDGYGPGVDRINPLVYSKTPQEFTVDTPDAGDADVKVTVTPSPQPGTISVSFVPREVGEQFLSIKRKKGGNTVKKPARLLQFADE